jgi:lipopolysaccharide/colanic/teichoic acid biosynthesis glycosyltransferase
VAVSQVTSATDSFAEGVADIALLPAKSGASYLITKRIIDAIGALALLVALLPVFLAVGIAIMLDSGWPILYLAPRVGLNGKTFTIVKFRSMRAGADGAPHVELVRRLLQDGDDLGSQLFKVSGDRRVTSLGAFLRRSSIDELPQLWNVLRGEMSLVGPRPDVTYSVDAYEPWMFRRLAATPGMTGLWQVSGRSRLGLRAMLRLDVEYVERRSLLLDLKILLMTIPAVTSTKNAA